jgi:glucokinase
MLIAGDVGGTKTLLGLFDGNGTRPQPIATRSYPTAAFSSFTDILTIFVGDVGAWFTVDAAAIGVAGPVVHQRARLTNVGWEISSSEIGGYFSTARVRLLNDLEAMATSVDALVEGDLEMLQTGIRDPNGNAVMIAAGTGLGEAFLHRVNGRLQPVPSEGGHADFAARTDREMDLVRMLRDERGRAEVEQVLSGPGFLNLHRLTHGGCRCAAVPDLSAADAPARVSDAGLDGTCAPCAEALGMFVEAYGAEAGNLAVRGVATAGVYVGGGIAPKILQALRDGRFMRAFLAKDPMSALVAKIPVAVILNQDAGLIGAAVAAADLLRT